MKLFVGNLPFSSDEDQIRELFETHGEVVSTAIITDRETGRSRGFGFVEMSDDSEAHEAIEALNDHSLDGRNLVVNKARPRNGGGGGGRPRGGNRW